MLYLLLSTEGKLRALVEHIDIIEIGCFFTSIIN